MAEQKLIQGTFHGSVGTLTGAKWKDKEVVKQKIWSKTPASPAQKSSVRSFECLNRLSSAIAKAWWYKLGLSNAKMHKHNAVAKLLAPVVANHTFDPSAIEEVFKADGTGAISAYSFDPETNLLEFTASTTLDVSAASGNSWLVVAFSVTGEVFLCESPAAATITRSLFVPVPADTEPYVMVLTTQKDRRRVRYGGFALKPSIATVEITFSLATDAITRTAANDTVSLTLSEPMPAGSYEVAIETHAIRQCLYADTAIPATLATDGTTAATLVFAPATDTLNQKDIFTLDSYIAIEAKTLLLDETRYKWTHQSLAAKTADGVSYTLANDITVTADTDGYIFSWGFPLMDNTVVSIGDIELNTVTAALVAGTANNFTASQTYNADRTALKETWQTPVIWGSDQTQGTSGASVTKSDITINIDFHWAPPNAPVFPPMSTELIGSLSGSFSAFTPTAPYTMEVKVGITLGVTQATVTPDYAPNVTLRLAKDDGTTGNADWEVLQVVGNEMVSYPTISQDGARWTSGYIEAANEIDLTLSNLQPALPAAASGVVVKIHVPAGRYPA